MLLMQFKDEGVSDELIRLAAQARLPMRHYH
jgi:hypothetical protein